MVAARAVAEREQHVDAPLRLEQRQGVADEAGVPGAFRQAVGKWVRLTSRPILQHAIDVLSVDRMEKSEPPRVGPDANLCGLSERVTSIDVARKRGVSQSTVSLVSRARRRADLRTRPRPPCAPAAEELGYRPNAAARALKTGAARAIVLVVPDITNPFFGGLLRGAQTAARAAGYAVALIDTEHDREWGSASAEALRAGLAGRAAAVRGRPAAARRAAGEPIVVIESESRGHPSARLDVEGGADAALRHLLDLGHRRIGHLASVLDPPTFAARARAVDRLVDAAGAA